MEAGDALTITWLRKTPRTKSFFSTTLTSLHTYSEAYGYLNEHDAAKATALSIKDSSKRTEALLEIVKCKRPEQGLKRELRVPTPIPTRISQIIKENVWNNLTLKNIGMGPAYAGNITNFTRGEWGFGNVINV